MPRACRKVHLQSHLRSSFGGGCFPPHSASLHVGLLDKSLLRSSVRGTMPRQGRRDGGHLRGQFLFSHLSPGLCSPYGSLTRVWHISPLCGHMLPQKKSRNRGMKAERHRLRPPRRSFNPRKAFIARNPRGLCSRTGAHRHMRNKCGW